MILAFALDKPRDLSSNQALSQIKKKFKIKKMGHTGTLDPFATGVLPVFIDEATKLIPYLDDSTKTYEAVLALGKATDTLDSTGLVVAEKKVPEISKEQIEECFKCFVGYRKQTPPQYSAIKIKGKALYRYAREGQEVKVEPRPIQIYALKLLSFENPLIRFEVKVSRGTYVRVLGEDLAQALGTVGHLQELRRHQSGVFNLEESISLSALLALDSLNSLEATFDARKLLLEMKVLHLEEEQLLSKILKGQSIELKKLEGSLPLKALVYFQDKLQCVGELFEDRSGIKILKPLRLFHS